MNENKCTALAKPMEPLFPVWRPGWVRDLARFWLWRERMLSDAVSYGVMSAADAKAIKSGSGSSDFALDYPTQELLNR